MAHRNRVDPWGRLIETPARGAWFGNRGCLHDRNGRITDRKPPIDAWIICLLEFKGRRRTLLQPGRYTELFFLDEATALAAGHRPCGECRLEDLRRFGALWPHKRARAPFALAPEIDAVLARQRSNQGDPLQADRIDPAYPPPDGAIFVFMDDGPDDPILCAQGALWRWTPFGYEGPLPWARRRQVQMLTPDSTLRTIVHGYRPQIHRSALR
jgi:hypothetical protein